LFMHIKLLCNQGATPQNFPKQECKRRVVQGLGKEGGREKEALKTFDFSIATL